MNGERRGGGNQRPATSNTNRAKTEYTHIKDGVSEPYFFRRVCDQQLILVIVSGWFENCGLMMISDFASGGKGHAI